MLRKQTGDSLENISDLLGHSNIAVTQIYLHRLEARPDAAWQKVEALLGLPASRLNLSSPAGQALTRGISPGGISPGGIAAGGNAAGKKAAGGYAAGDTNSGRPLPARQRRRLRPPVPLITII